MNLLHKMTAIAALVLASAGASAEFISSDDWWLTTDNLGGLRQHSGNPDYFFAVAKNNVWDKNATYGNIDGYRIATTEEGQVVFTGSNSPSIYSYYNQGGWNGYTWEGQQRLYFRFADSVQTGAYKHAGQYDSSPVYYSPNEGGFAGMVMIRDANATSLPNNAPHSTAVSDVSAPVLLGAGVGLLLMGLRRRKV